jgi:nucleotide-binding universal stress UspA family protein
VVGVDGSAGAGAALTFALQEAIMRRASLRVVAAVPMPDYGLASIGTVTLPRPQALLDDVGKAAQLQVDEAVAAYGAGADGIAIDVQARAGQPGPVLCGVAEGAELPVVGHRGRGSIASTMIGSVGLHCVLYGPCPVTVVRVSTEAGPAPR